MKHPEIRCGDLVRVTAIHPGSSAYKRRKLYVGLIGRIGEISDLWTWDDDEWIYGVPMRIIDFSNGSILYRYFFAAKLELLERTDP